MRHSVYLVGANYKFSFLASPLILDFIVGCFETDWNSSAAVEYEFVPPAAFSVS